MKKSEATKAVARLKKLGYEVYYLDAADLWSVWFNGRHSGYYITRKLIKFAKHATDHPWRPAATEKAHVGPGGVDCSCCTKAPRREMKLWERRAIRRQNKKLETAA